jgi:hypothetical protein
MEIPKPKKPHKKQKQTVLFRQFVFDCLKLLYISLDNFSVECHG